jgi:CheY-like chemotaxis protein
VLVAFCVLIIITPEHAITYETGSPCFSFRIRRRLQYYAARRLSALIKSGSGKVVAKTGNHNQKHIFVINDTIAILELFTALLEDEGYRVTTDGFMIEMVELLRRVKADRPDLLVLDFLIQDEGKGWQFLQMLKMDRETRDIPVVVCTAAIKLVDDLQAHLDSMGVGVVLKPFDIEVLLAEIDKMWRIQDPG